ncbi:MAG TPA: hypothetical protein VFI13_05195 [Gemmatimonadales bacterium]|nr:hypothetical protein [Gemmatimonadales bacterium]
MITPPKWLLIVGAIAVARPAAAQRPDPWAAEVVRALAAAGRAVGERDAKTAGPPWTGVLSTGGTTTFPVRLTAGVKYVVIAACDRDCARLGLQVRDPRHYDLAADASATRQPAVVVTPSVSGAHTITLTMGACRVAPCRVGVLVVEAGPPGGGGEAR